MNHALRHRTFRTLIFAAIAAIGLAMYPQHVGAASSSVIATPSVSASGNGTTASFTVTWTSTSTGTGYVLFGPGPGCNGLVGTAIEAGAPSTQHSVVVTGNQLDGSAGPMPIQPGQTYSFEVVTASSSGRETDSNGGACYSVTIPSSAASLAAGAVYTMTNNASGNSVVVLTHGANGQLTVVQTVPTRGKGAGFLLDSQGGIVVSSDQRFLFAVNAGDGSLTSFRITAGGLVWASRVASGGGEPLSVTSFGNLVYVLNQSSNPSFVQQPDPSPTVDAVGNISGFTVGSDGVLTPIPGSTQPAGQGGREISFDPTGSVLVETNRTENNIYTYIVGPGGVAETPTKTASADPNPFGPFGFAFDSAGNMIVADSNTSPDDSVSNPAGASSYSVSDTGTVLPETTFAPNTQNISCWMVVVGKYAYETNAIGATTLSQIPKVGPGTISSYSIGANGALTLAQGVAATLPGTPTIPGNFAVDEAASPDGKYLYVLDINLPPNIPDGAQVDTFAINGDGSLTYVGTSGPMPGGPGFAGMAASQSLVFTETNSATGNSVLMLSHSGGSLSVDQTVASGGKGVGFFLDSQGAVNASSDGRFVFAVNAGANSLSSFRIGQGGLTLVNTVPSNGAFPYSVTSFGNLVYVLNGSANTSFVPTGGSAGGTDEAGSISGYTVGLDGTLTPISGSTQPTGVGPREVRFDNSGKTLVVTNRTSNDIYTYPVGANGAAGAPVKSPSADPSPFGPFGFAFDGANHLIVADSNTGPMFAPNNPAGASSYNVNADGTLAPISSFVANGQNISCWVVIVGKFAYTTNPLGTTTVSQLPNLGPGTISSYRVHTDGRLTLAQGAAGVLPGVPGIPGNFAVDEAASTDGQYLYVLGINLPPSIPNPAEINTFAINGDGTLTYVGSTTSLPGGPGFTGLATT